MTALHELSTGCPAAAQPLDPECFRFGDLNYAKEELRAELASVVLMAERGIPHNLDSHAADLGLWLQAPRDDRHEMYPFQPEWKTAGREKPEHL